MSSSEDFIQRSLFSSLLGSRIRPAKFDHDQAPPTSSLSGNSRTHSSAPPPFNYGLPCSSKAAARQDDARRQQIHCQYSNPVKQQQQQQQQYSHEQRLSIAQLRQDTVTTRQRIGQKEEQQQHQQQQTARMQLFQQHNFDNNSNNIGYGIYENSPPPMAAGNVSLSDQLSESLFLASPQPFESSQTSPAAGTFEFEAYGTPQSQGPTVASPHDIYQQIVHECEPFLDQRRHFQPVQCEVQPQSRPDAYSPISNYGVGTLLSASTCHSLVMNELPYDNNKCIGGYDAPAAAGDSDVFADLNAVSPYKIGSDVRFADSFVESAVEALASEILIETDPIQRQPSHQQQQQQICREKSTKKLTRHPKLEVFLETLSPFGNLSLEEFVKMVVAAGRYRSAAQPLPQSPQTTLSQPTTVMAPSPTRLLDPTVSGETAEEILQRKRQQNNEAAARYRKRLRKARLIAEDEINNLQRRNESLRAEIRAVGCEIDALKSKFVVAEALTTNIVSP